MLELNTRTDKEPQTEPQSKAEFDKTENQEKLSRPHTGLSALNEKIHLSNVGCAVPGVAGEKAR